MERGVEVETLLFDVRDGIATIKLNRPDVLNAINPQVYQELSEVFESLFFNREVRVVILTGAGDRAFAAGADISAMSTFSSAQARSFARLGKRAVDRIVSLPQPVVAAVNGLALGGGCELAMACDFRIASSRAKFGQPEINLGIIPGGGGSSACRGLLVLLGRSGSFLRERLSTPAKRWKWALLTRWLNRRN